MRPAEAARPAAHSDREPRRVDDWLDTKIGTEAKAPKTALQDRAIRAELTGSDTCSVAGITTRSTSPVLALCRALLSAGHNPDSPLEVYRGEVLALTVRWIGIGTDLEVSGEGTGFRPRRQPDAAPPVRRSPLCATRGTP